MALSGTRSWTLTVDAVIREALERLGGEQTLGNDISSAIRTLNLVITELTNRGINLWAMQESVILLATSVTTFTLAASVVDILGFTVRSSTNVDLEAERIGFIDYMRIPNKSTSGRPTQYFMDRRYDAAVVYFWPVPNQTYYGYFWNTRRIQDATQLNEDLQIPFRFMTVLAAGVAYYMGMKRPGVTQERLAVLKTQFEEAFSHACEEDRDRIPLTVNLKLNKPK